MTCVSWMLPSSPSSPPSLWSAVPPPATPLRSSSIHASIQSVSSVVSCAPVPVLRFVSLVVTSLVFSFNRYVLLAFSKCFHSPITGSGTKFYFCGVCVTQSSVLVSESLVFFVFRSFVFVNNYFRYDFFTKLISRVSTGLEILENLEMSRNVKTRKVRKFCQKTISQGVL